MALQVITPVRVQEPREEKTKRESSLDKVLKAMQAIKAGTGIAVDIQQFRKMGEELAPMRTKRLATEAIAEGRVDEHLKEYLTQTGGSLIEANIEEERQRKQGGLAEAITRGPVEIAEGVAPKVIVPRAFNLGDIYKEYMDKRQRLQISEKELGKILKDPNRVETTDEKGIIRVKIPQIKLDLSVEENRIKRLSEKVLKLKKQRADAADRLTPADKISVWDRLDFMRTEHVTSEEFEKLMEKAELETTEENIREGHTEIARRKGIEDATRDLWLPIGREPDQYDDPKNLIGPNDLLLKEGNKQWIIKNFMPKIESNLKIAEILKKGGGTTTASEARKGYNDVVNKLTDRIIEVKKSSNEEVKQFQSASNAARQALEIKADENGTYSAYDVNTLGFLVVNSLAPSAFTSGDENLWLGPRRFKGKFIAALPKDFAEWVDVTLSGSLMNSLGIRESDMKGMNKEQAKKYVNEKIKASKQSSVQARVPGEVVTELKKIIGRAYKSKLNTVISHQANKLSTAKQAYFSGARSWQPNIDQNVLENVFRNYVAAGLAPGALPMSDVNKLISEEPIMDVSQVREQFIKRGMTPQEFDSRFPLGPAGVFEGETLDSLKKWLKTDFMRDYKGPMKPFEIDETGVPLKPEQEGQQQAVVPQNSFQQLQKANPEFYKTLYRAYENKLIDQNSFKNFADNYFKNPSDKARNSYTNTIINQLNSARGAR